MLLIVMALIASSGCCEKLHFSKEVAVTMKTKRNDGQQKRTRSWRKNSQTEISNKSSYDIRNGSSSSNEEDGNLDEDEEDKRETHKGSRQLARSLSKEMLFNKEMSCLPIKLTVTTATISMQQHALNVTTSVSSQQILEELWSFVDATVSSNKATCPTSAPSSSSSLSLRSPGTTTTSASQQTRSLASRQLFNQIATPHSSNNCQNSNTISIH